MAAALALVLTFSALLSANVALGFSPTRGPAVGSALSATRQQPPPSSYRGYQDDENDFDYNYQAERSSGGRNGYNSGRGRNGGHQNKRNGGGGRGRNQKNDRRNGGRNERRPRPEPEEEVAITDTNKHFFSKKPLTDTTFRYNAESEHNKELFDSLCRGAGITRPSRIQSLAWPKILTGSHTVVADQTGSGKTLAYLIPLLQKALSDDEPKKKIYGAPKVLILAPTAELADQIREVCAKISETVPFKTMVVTATGKFTTSIRDQIRIIQRQPVDVMISTPGRVSTILRTRNSGLDLSRLQTIVLDEVDILLVDQTFGPQLRTVGAAAPLDQTQFVFCTATLPDTIVEKVQAEFPGVIQVRGPGLHRVAPTVKERLIDVSVPSKFNRDSAYCFNIKSNELLKSLQKTPCRRTLIFCNTVESCRQVENLLSRKDRRGKMYNVGAYHNAMTPEARNANLAAFTRAGEQKLDERQIVDHVLVCTDRAARGVDFDSSPVDHVVIFDFPKDPAEYVRRVGRTARAGRAGASTVFAYGWQLPIARSVMSGKLETITTRAYDEHDEEEGEEDLYISRKMKNKKESIKSTIEDGRLWD